MHHEQSVFTRSETALDSGLDQLVLQTLIKGEATPLKVRPPKVLDFNPVELAARVRSDPHTIVDKAHRVLEAEDLLFDILFAELELQLMAE